MNEIYLYAPAKINLTLDIISKRPDGYHNISSVMQTISLSDSIKIEKTRLPGVKILSNINWLAKDENNLVYRIASDLINEYNLDFGVRIKLFKRIPIGAGLAGGSADCAATLKGMIELFDLRISTCKAYKICERYGADVPFCFMGGTALAKGIGNILHRLPNHPKTYVLLAKPKFSLSTEKIYKMIKAKDMRLSDPKKIINAIKFKNRKAIAANFHNTFESIVTSSHPIIAQIKETMIKNGGLGACMSGSGPTVFGYYDNFEDAKKTASLIENTFPPTKTYFAKTL
jgi:4-diphosphocytidyl-2C-methyl-D-erythritol kinase